MKKKLHLNYSILPTSIYKMNNLSKKYNADIYIMRDDMTGFAFGGNKTRKLDYLIYDAKRKNTDAIIAVGSVQSNFCRIAAGYGAADNLDVYLLLSGKKPDKPTGNLLLDYLFNAKISYTDSTDNSDVENESKILEQELKKKGKNVYRMPMGGSTPVGVLGYLEAFEEILDYEKVNDLHFDYIFHASGSGGTQAGLVLGKILTGWHGEITGFSVGRSALELKNVVGDLVNRTGSMLNTKINETNIYVDDRYIGDGYGKKTFWGTEAINDFARNEGILLDNVYTGKAAAGMIDYINSGKIRTGSKILFIHTGGNVELFE